jgi:hypothetical protein
MFKFIIEFFSLSGVCVCVCVCSCWALLGLPGREEFITEVAKASVRENGSREFGIERKKRKERMRRGWREWKCLASFFWQPSMSAVFLSVWWRMSQAGSGSLFFYPALLRKEEFFFRCQHTIKITFSATGKYSLTPFDFISMICLVFLVFVGSVFLRSTSPRFSL